MACKALDAGMHLHQACKPMDGKRKRGFEEVKGGVPMFAIGIVSSLVLILYHLCRLFLLLRSKNPRTGGNR